VEYALLAAVLLLAIGTRVSVRRLSRKLEALTQSYWELRYDYTRLRSRVSRLGGGEDAGDAPVEPVPPAPSESFVPLSAIRKKPAQ